MRTVLITGANKGLGFETARQLGQRGDRILVGARKLALGEAAAQKLRSEKIEAHALELDLDAPSTISAAARFIEAEYGQLDVLINNAGIADQGDRLPSEVSLDVVRRTIETNFVGTLAVTQAMLPLLRKAPAARIVNVSSSLGSLTAMSSGRLADHKDAQLTAYTASKAALNMLTVMLASELRGSTIQVNAVNPGYTATDLNANRGVQSVAEGAQAQVRAALPELDGSGGFYNAGGVEPW